MFYIKFGWNWHNGSGEEDFLILFMYPLFRKYLPLKNFEHSWISFTKRCFVPSLVESGPVVQEKKMKMWKVYNNDDDGQRINFNQKSSLEPLAQVS